MFDEKRRNHSSLRIMRKLNYYNHSVRTIQIDIQECFYTIYAC